MLKLKDNEILVTVYLTMVLLNIWFVFLLPPIRSDLPPLHFWVDTKLMLIPYLLMCSTIFIFLFSEKCNSVLKNAQLPKFLSIILIIGSIIFTFIGNYGAIDNGTDNDEALSVWIDALLSGNFPYSAHTQLGNPISPFPFMPIYSIIYKFMGDVSFQNIVNVTAIIYIIYCLSENNVKLIFGLSSLIISIPLWYLLLIQSDHLTVVTPMALTTYLLLINRFIYGSFLVGFLIASKGYAWLIIPTIIYYFTIKEGSCKSLIYFAISAIIAGILIVPFIIWNPTIFFNVAPIGLNNSYFPGLLKVLPLISIIISLLSFHLTRNLFMSIALTYIIFMCYQMMYIRTSIIILIFLMMWCIGGINNINKIKRMA